MKLPCNIPSPAATVLLLLLHASPLALGAVVGQRSGEADVVTSSPSTDEAPTLRERLSGINLTEAALQAANYMYPNPWYLYVPGNNFMTQCYGSHNDELIDIKGLNFRPLNVRRGETFFYDFTATIYTGIDHNQKILPGTKIHVNITLGANTIYKKEFDFCDEAGRAAHVRCPIENSIAILPWIKRQIEVPADLPLAIYRIYVNTIRPDGRQVSCIYGDFRVF